MPARIFLPFLREVQPSIIILDTKQICSRLSFYASWICLESGQFFFFFFQTRSATSASWELRSRGSLRFHHGRFYFNEFTFEEMYPSLLLSSPPRAVSISEGIEISLAGTQGVIFTEQRGKIQRGGREERTGEKKEKEERPNGSQEEKRTAREGRGGRATGERSRKRERARDR